MLLQMLLTGVVVVLWMRLIVVNLRGLPLARELYVQHHPDLTKAEAERRITRGTLQALAVNSAMFALLLWAVWAW